MLTKDHVTLGYTLINKRKEDGLNYYEKCFLLGCIGPDINPFTYLKGGIKYKKLFEGHCRKNCQKYIHRIIDKLMSKKYLGGFQYFQLGRIIHYISDSLTFTHTHHFKGNVKEHLEYEEELHKYIDNSINDISISSKYSKISLKKFLLLQYKKYDSQIPNVKYDLKYIINTCTIIKNSILICANPEIFSEVCYN